MSDIPGNRPEDLDFEQFWEWLDDQPLSLGEAREAIQQWLARHKRKKKAGGHAQP